MIFQDPLASLNPQWRVAEIVEEPLVGFGIGNASQRRRAVNRLLEAMISAGSGASARASATR
jgi:oligopeptide transport system ATP-binding protein